MEINKNIKSAEELMMEFYKEKEIKARENYKKALYANPPPPTDEEIQRRKWKTDRNKYR